MKSQVLLVSLVALFCLTAALPSSFDARKTYPQCLAAVTDQGECGSSLLIQVVNDLTASACLSTGKTVKLSTSYVLNCCKQCGGCDGTNPAALSSWMATNGTVTSDCAGTNPTCPVTKCADGSPLRFYRAKLRQLHGVEQIQEAIMATGPVLAYLDADSLEEYNGGVLTCSSSQKTIDDAVSLVGWGTQGGVDYWIGVNTWGADWGENGYFQIARGVNACAIEEDNYAVQFIDR